MIEIKTLVLNNFGIFENSKIEFNSGINILNGLNGKGKSTCLQAIKMLLLNDFEGTLEQYINNNSNNMFAELTFVFSNNIYISSIKVVKNKTTTSTRKLIKNNIIVAENSDVIDYLNNLLSNNITKYALCVEQKNINKITGIKDSERRDLFKYLLDIDFSNEIKNHYDVKIENLKNKIESSKSVIQTLNNMSYTKKDIIDLPFSIDEINSKKDKLSKLANIEKSFANNESIKSKINNYNENVNKLQNEIMSLKDDILNNQKKLNQLLLDEKNRIERENSNYNNKINELYDKKNAEIRDVEIQLLNLIKIKDELANKLSNIKIVRIKKINDDYINDFTNKIALLKKSIVDDKNKIDDINNKLKLIDNNICPYSNKTIE